jgi:large subunit ribosomal protein L4
MKLPVMNAEGKELRQLEVDETVFGIEPNGPILHQAFVTSRANQRAGTANTKTRGEVQGSTHKIRMQKYTGRARQGSIRAPHHVGGGTVFGPRQRSYAKDLPRRCAGWRYAPRFRARWPMDSLCSSTRSPLRRRRRKK